jgi:hypothetical protein
LPRYSGKCFEWLVFIISFSLLFRVLNLKQDLIT